MYRWYHDLSVAFAQLRNAPYDAPAVVLFKVTYVWKKKMKSSVSCYEIEMLHFDSNIICPAIVYIYLYQAKVRDEIYETILNWKWKIKN